MAKRLTADERYDVEKRELLARVAGLTRQIDSITDQRTSLVDERAEVCEQLCDEYGSNPYEIGEAAGRHHSVIARSIERWRARAA